MWMLWLTSLLTICVLTSELWSFPSAMIHTEEDKKWVDHRLLRADGISDGKSTLFPHISLAQKLEHVVWFSSLNSFPPPVEWLPCFRALPQTPALAGRVSGLERAAGMDLGPSELLSLFRKPSACWVLSPPLPCWRKSAAKERWREGKRTGSTGASAIIP